jgi:PAS domain S-box-containing protein
MRAVRSPNAAGQRRCRQHLIDKECEIVTNGRPPAIDSLQAALEAERYAAEAALRESEERFRAVWEATSEALALSDRDGVVLAVNPAYSALYGLPPEQVVGHSFAAIFPEEAREAAMQQYHAVFTNSNPPSSYEARVQRPDGTERIVEARADFLVRDGERVAMISAIRDITEHTRAERVQQDFIAMASHDLLTPVTVLRARAQLQQRRKVYDEASMVAILEQTTRIERMITELPTGCESSGPGTSYASRTRTYPSLVTGTQTGWDKSWTTCSATRSSTRPRVGRSSSGLPRRGGRRV